MGSERLLRLPGVDERPVRKETLGLADRVLGAIARRHWEALVTDRQRVHHAEAPAVLGADRGPMEVESPAVAQRGEGRERPGGVATVGGDRPDLHEARLAHER